MAYLAFYFGASVLFAQFTSAFNCSQPPIYVDIHKRVVHGTDIFQYGSFIGVGTPAQNQSLWPSLRQNQTSVASTQFCDNSTLVDCAQSTRGNFDTSLSTSWMQTNGYTSLDSNMNGSYTGIFGKDDLHLYTHYFETDGASQNIVSNYTLEVATNGSVSPGVIGIGLSSTLLQSLFDEGLIAGRTYSLYVGSGMDRAGGVINGSNTFGGYDAGRFTGLVHKYPMNISDSNPLSVYIQDIVLNDPTGLTQNISLFDPKSFPTLHSRPDAFEAKITTDQYPLSLPYEITQNYIAQLAAIPSGNADGSLKLNKPFNGTMSLILSDGFTITLPADVMFNTSGLSPVAVRDQNSTEPFYFSVAALSQVYLMADFDSYSFYLAQAIAQQQAVMPVTFCPKTTPSPYNPPRQSNFVAQGMIGAVIGGVIGGSGIIGFAICFGLAWARQRAQRKKEKRYEEEMARAKTMQFDADGKFEAPLRTAGLVQFDVDDKDVVFDAPPRNPGKTGKTGKTGKAGKTGFWRSKS
ncbi:acid protease [Lepidopterella palustris CBS 459.81]|uniref:Acid protease n=1 Tax=Lepidopterella palustris CBS 459.81 TaxID=1314670 RepID=A0A8E2E337_9PEZI|nr:acid protease [Lepidopterella palustris CBS 459.81]